MFVCYSMHNFFCQFDNVSCSLLHLRHPWFQNHHDYTATVKMTREVTQGVDVLCVMEQLKAVAHFQVQVSGAFYLISIDVNDVTFTSVFLGTFPSLQSSGDPCSPDPPTWQQHRLYHMPWRPWRNACSASNTTTSHEQTVASQLLLQLHSWICHDFDLWMALKQYHPRHNSWATERYFSLAESAMLLTGWFRA